jgi:hypothetical protein
VEERGRIDRWTKGRYGRTGTRVVEKEDGEEGQVVKDGSAVRG